MEDKNLAEALARSVDESTGSEQKPPDNVTEDNIQLIIKMGFTREEAIQELRKCNGDVNLAAASLLAKSLKVPTT